MLALVTLRKGPSKRVMLLMLVQALALIPIDEKLNNIMLSIQDISTKLSELASIMHSQYIHFDTKFTSLQTQLDQIQRKLEEDED